MSLVGNRDQFISETKSHLNGFCHRKRNRINFITCLVGARIFLRDQVFKRDIDYAVTGNKNNRKKIKEYITDNSYSIKYDIYMGVYKEQETNLTGKIRRQSLKI